MAGDQQQDRAQLLKATNELGEAENAIKGVQNTFTSEMEALAGQWVGNASSAFAGAVGAFNERFNKTLQELNQITEQLKLSTQDYTTNEEEQTQSVSSISGLING
ncbi:WXG100 family type VII secretion target [Propionibacterium sp. oral taxon 192 str. F0372]|uniref:WXG100 family type VII secretion target n=1 Tax=Propionibacterium sp. oral taxon 192 TaxID=671222 RepID=UPI000353A4B6|nr:WXG100 family type VII secretion target [Propionibacterium sp. oral taxon 192]EPH05627.1 WXG100 family type VII secretion target [Propionibacterium sp. oral taxon 192 str. F0372]